MTLPAASHPSLPSLEAARWWQKGVVYQIYPLSFLDSNGDGMGDLEGIRARLDHLVWLGVDAVWISPIYPSPMADFGYDVSDHCGIDPRFGTLDEFDSLLRDMHARGLRVILDFIPNHTSDQHPWFRESRSSRNNAKRDWYIWRDPAPEGGPPSNWLSEFGGPAWHLDPDTGQYYYHAFLAEQPDLNWRNPEVRAAMYAVLRFWVERGVDGFRVDAIHHLFKDELLRDNPPNPQFAPGMSPRRRLIRQFTTDLPEVHGAVREMRRLIESHGDRVLIGEAWLPFDRLMAYYGDDLDCFHLPFNFHLIGTRWEAAAISSVIAEYEAALPDGAWPNWVLGNHDRSRIASRVGAAQARVAAVLLCTLRGTPTLYYGDELGMQDVPIPPEAVQDPYEKNVPGLGLGRDPARTPMQWSTAAHAGFSNARPWLPLAADHRERNVEVQLREPGSMLHLYRTLLELRRKRPTLAIGDYRPLEQGPGVLGYLRELGTATDAALLNLTSNAGQRHAPERYRRGPRAVVDAPGSRRCALRRSAPGQRGSRSFSPGLTPSAVRPARSLLQLPGTWLATGARASPAGKAETKWTTSLSSTRARHADGWKAIGFLDSTNYVQQGQRSRAITDEFAEQRVRARSFRPCSWPEPLKRRERQYASLGRAGLARSALPNPRTHEHHG